MLRFAKKIKKISLYTSINMSAHNYGERGKNADSNLWLKNVNMPAQGVREGGKAG